MPFTLTSRDAATCLMDYLEMAVLAALDKANRRMQSHLPRPERHHGAKFRDLDMWQRHTVLPVGTVDLDWLLGGAYMLLDHTSKGQNPCLRGTVDTYVRTVLTHQQPYRREDLHACLAAAGCIQHDPS